jgi:transposase
VHEHAFAHFGGVFSMLPYDNLADTVRKILRGYRRKETVRFMAFRSEVGVYRATAQQLLLYLCAIMLRTSQVNGHVV